MRLFRRGDLAKKQWSSVVESEDDESLAENVEVQDVYYDMLHPMNFMKNLLYCRPCKTWVVRELLPGEVKIMEASVDEDDVEVLDENGQWISSADCDDQGHWVVRPLYPGESKLTHSFFVDDEVEELDKFGRWRVASTVEHDREGYNVKSLHSHEKPLRLRGGAPPRNSRSDRVSILKLHRYCTTVHRGLGSKLSCNDTSSRALQRNTYCCCIACAVRDDDGLCQCNKCAIFRHERIKDGTLDELSDHVMGAIRQARNEANARTKKERKVFLEGILSSAIKSFTPKHYARVWYEVGAAGNRIAVCQETYAKAYKTSVRQLQRVVSRVSKEDYLLPSQRPLSDTLGVDADMVKTAETYAEKLGFELTAEERAAFQTPSSLKKGSAAAWIRRYATFYGDLMPDADNEWHIDPIDKVELWREYCSEVKKELKEDPLSLSEFYRTWRVFCFNIKVREFKNVTGKCAVCAHFSDLRKKALTVEARAEVVACWLFHRATYSLERKAYHDRRTQATTPGHTLKYWSFIGDGMQQVRFKV
jgi:hypothetical protein